MIQIPEGTVDKILAALCGVAEMKEVYEEVSLLRKQPEWEAGLRTEEGFRKGLFVTKQPYTTYEVSVVPSTRVLRCPCDDEDCLLHYVEESRVVYDEPLLLGRNAVYLLNQGGGTKEHEFYFLGGNCLQSYKPKSATAHHFVLFRESIEDPNYAKWLGFKE